MIIMSTEQRFATLALLVLGACSGDSAHLQPLVPSAIKIVSGDGQSGRIGSLLPNPLVVEVTDGAGNVAPGIEVNWSVVTGGGSIAPATSVTDANGMASAGFTLGPAQGEQRAQAQASGLTGPPVVLTAIGCTDVGCGHVERGAGGGNNVPDRYNSDLWVHGNFAYTGTWGFRKQLGNVFNVWSLDPAGAPTLAGSVTVPSIGTVSDLQVSDDGQLLVVSGERGDNGGIYTYSLADPAHPAFLGSALVGSPGVHTVTLATISGRNYAFAARNPVSAAPRTTVRPWSSTT